MSGGGELEGINVSMSEGGELEGINVQRA